MSVTCDQLPPGFVVGFEAATEEYVQLTASGGSISTVVWDVNISSEIQIGSTELHWCSIHSLVKH
jgi:hypothetical protein